MLASKFWAEYCLPSRPRGSILNWKRTSWKKLLVFLEVQVRDGLICINTTEHGVTSIVAVIKDHPKLEAFRTMNINETAEADLEFPEPVVDESKPIIQEFWTLHKKLEFLLVVLEGNVEEKGEEENLEEIELLKSLLKGNSDRTQYFTKPQITALLWNYVQARDLADPKNPKVVKLDLNLCAALYPGGKAQAGDVVGKKELAEAFNAKIVPIQMVKVNGEVKIEKGTKVGAITVLVESRGGSKLVTRIQGLHHFGLDIKDVSKRASKKFAASAGQGKDGNGQEEILLQGNLEKLAPAFLTQEFNIPAKHIKVEVKGNVKTKKR
jgi:translation initiation factor 2D